MSSLEDLNARIARDAEIAENLRVEKLLLNDLKETFGIEIDGLNDLMKVDPCGRLLDHLIEQFKSVSLQGLKEDLLVIIWSTREVVDAAPFIHAYENFITRTDRFRDDILQMFWHMKAAGVGEWLVEIARTTSNRRASFFVFAALVKQVEKEVAEPIIRDRFWDAPGPAAQSLAKIGDISTVRFLCEKLEEFERIDWKTKNPILDVTWHRIRIKGAIDSLQRRIAKRLVTGKGAPRPKARVKPDADRSRSTVLFCSSMHGVEGRADTKRIVSLAGWSFHIVRRLVHESLRACYSRDIAVFFVKIILLPVGASPPPEPELTVLSEKGLGVSIKTHMLFEQLGRSQQEQIKQITYTFLEAMNRIIEHLRLLGKHLDESKLRADLARLETASQKL